MFSSGALLSPSIQAAQQQLNHWGARGEPGFFLIDFALGQALVWPLAQAAPAQVLYQVNGRHNLGPAQQAEAAQLTTRYAREGLRFTAQPPDFAEYEKSFALVMSHLRAGNTYLCNLTWPTPIHCNWGLRELFFLTQAKYKCWLPGQFVCFSPETFVQMGPLDPARPAGPGWMRTHPMKGTISEQVPQARQVILADAKEHAEHTTIVDLLRNDLSQVAERVTVGRFRYVERVRTHTGAHLLQVSSEIEGQLAPGWPARLGDLLFSLLPAGSICGAPKPKTLDIIAEAEPGPRGWYTGICGLFDGQRLDTGVMIRFIEQGPEQLVFRSGGGITHRSQVASEYHELLDKVYLPIGPFAGASDCANEDQSTRI
ncbi:MAG: aminodeoxychorismate synthase component I [Bernardetiaceae bacterium]|jgi:para-aminobenzoate synthetase component 1|nr:aminodeoxychorismate synthase component I [Bernardetiaceae bacterium]